MIRIFISNYPWWFINDEHFPRLDWRFPIFKNSNRNYLIWLLRHIVVIDHSNGKRIFPWVILVHRIHNRFLMMILRHVDQSASFHVDQRVILNAFSCWKEIKLLRNGICIKWPMLNDHVCQLSRFKFLHITWATNQHVYKSQLNIFENTLIKPSRMIIIIAKCWINIVDRW